MADKKTIIIGFLTVIILASITYVTLNDKVRIRVDHDRSTFYVPHETYHWIWTVSGRELNKLFDGTSLMYRDRSSINVSTVVDNVTNRVTITRETQYQRGPVIIDTYVFYADQSSVELFPISHTVEVLNAKDKIYQYSVRDLEYDGDTIKNVNSPQSFGKNMKVEWDESQSYWNTVYKSGIMKVRFRPQSDYEKYNVRLFDPVYLTLSLAGQESNIDAELGSNISVFAGFNSSTNVCVDVDHPLYGDNYSCANNETSFIFNASHFVLTKFNDSTETKSVDSSDSLITPTNIDGTDNWDPNHNYTSMFDEDLFTYGVSNTTGTNSYAYWNYSFPSWATQENTTINMKYRDNDGITTYDYSETIQNRCFNSSSSSYRQDGSIICDGTWDATHTCLNASDKSTSTYGSAATDEISIVWLNFTKPANAVFPGTTLRLYVGAGYADVDFTSAYSGCWDLGDNMKLRVQLNESNNWIRVGCLNSSSALLNLTYGDVSNKFYEAKMTWNYPGSANFKTWSKKGHTLVLYCLTYDTRAWLQFFPSADYSMGDAIYEFEMSSFNEVSNVYIDLDNRTDLDSARVNVTGVDNSTDVQIDFGADGITDVFLLGSLNSNLLEVEDYTYDGNSYDSHNISYGGAGRKTIFLNLSTEGITSAAKLTLSGFNVDIGNQFNFVENFNTTDQSDDDYWINDSLSLGAGPLVIWTEFEHNDTSYDDWAQTTNNWDGNNTISSDQDDNYLQHYIQKTNEITRPTATVRWIEDKYTGIDLNNVSMFRIVAKLNDSIRRVGTYTTCEGEFNTEIYLTDSSSKSFLGNMGKYLSESSTSWNSQSTGYNWTFYKKGDNEWDMYNEGNFIAGGFTTSNLDPTQPWYLIIKDETRIWSSSDTRCDYILDHQYRKIYVGGVGMGRDKVGCSAFGDCWYSGTFNNSKDYVVSINLTEFSTNVSAVKLTSSHYKPLSGMNISYYVSNNGGNNWTRIVSGFRQSFDSDGDELAYNITFDTSNSSQTPIVYWVKLDVSPSLAENITVDVGLDGTTDWSHTGNISGSSYSVDLTNNSATTSYLDDQCAGDNLCLLPIGISSELGGLIEVSEVSLNKTINPITINVSKIENLHGDIPFEFQFIDGNITLSDLQIYYVGGNQTFEVDAHNDDYSVNKSYNVTYWYSGYNWSYPRNIDYLEFIPRYPTSKNVTPYGQKRSKPIFNFTLDTWASKNANLTILLNETYSCVNLTASTTFSKPNGTLLAADTWVDLGNDLADGTELDVWMWADYDCNYTEWVFWEPELFFKGCCYGCDVCYTSYR